MRNPWFLALASGLLLGLAFPPMPGGLLSFVAFVPLLYVWAMHAHTWSRWKLFGLTYTTFFVYHAMSNWWVCSWQEQTDPYLFASGIALGLGHPVFLGLPWFVLASLRTHFGLRAMLWLAPFAIGGAEWVHGQTDLSYPWLSTGYMLINTPLAQAADLVGVYGLTTAIVTVNAVIVLLLVRAARSPRRVVVVMSAALLLWATYGLWNINRTWDRAGEDRLLAGMVQPNANPWDKWSDPRIQVEDHRRLVDSLRRDRQDVDLFVWSETAIPYAIRLPLHERDWNALRTWIDSSNVTILTGFSDLLTYAPNTAPPSARASTADPSLRYDAFNAAMLVMPSVDSIAVHRKTNLTPFAERLPFADQFTFAMEWIQWGVGISAWGKGRVRDPLPLAIDGVNKARIGAIICIESIYPETARDLVNNGADVLCVITNDAWYNGTPGPRQHYDIGRMRAIEQRRWVMRCGNSGVSGFIDPSGTSINVIAPMTTGVAVGSVQTMRDRTVYAMIGDVVPPAGAAATILLWLATRFPGLLRKLRIRTNRPQGNETP